MVVDTHRFGLKVNGIISGRRTDHESGPESVASRQVFEMLKLLGYIRGAKNEVFGRFNDL